MSTITSRLKRAVIAAKSAMGPQQYGRRGKPFACRLCDHDRFIPGPHALMFSLHTLACAECGHIEFFAKHPPLLDAD